MLTSVCSCPHINPLLVINTELKKRVCAHVCVCVCVHGFQNVNPLWTCPGLLLEFIRQTNHISCVSLNATYCVCEWHSDLGCLSVDESVRCSTGGFGEMEREQKVYQIHWKKDSCGLLSLRVRQRVRNGKGLRWNVCVCVCVQVFDIILYFFYFYQHFENTTF